MFVTGRRYHGGFAVAIAAEAHWIASRFEVPE